MKPIYITGYDWETCYIHHPEVKTRKDQVLSDLETEIKQRGDCLMKGDILDIEVLDHSMAFEMFQVEKILKDSIFLTYAGGAS